MKRFDVYIINLDPTIGREIKKTRPCVIVSPNDLNDHFNTVTIVPLTTGRAYPFRPKISFSHRNGIAAVDQIRTVSKSRLIKKAGILDSDEGLKILQTLREMFSE